MDVERERGEREMRGVIEGVNIIKVHYMYGLKCHNDTQNFVLLICANKTLIRKNARYLLCSRNFESTILLLSANLIVILQAS
jgi:hypothetical protein